MTHSGFSTTFDTSVRLCAQAQQEVARSSELMARVRASREQRAALRQARRIAREARGHLSTVSHLFSSLRIEVELATDHLRLHGADEHETLETVRARVRFALYDAQFGEHEAEPVVQHAERWVRERYQAA